MTQVPLQPSDPSKDSLVPQESTRVEDEDYKRAEAIALSASQILSSRQTKSKLLLPLKTHRVNTAKEKFLTDPNQRRLVEQSIQEHDSQSHSREVSRHDSKKDFGFSSAMNNAMDKIKDIIQNSPLEQSNVSPSHLPSVSEPVSNSSNSSSNGTGGADSAETTQALVQTAPEHLPPTLTAIVYKRRSGLGLLSSKAWERRKLVLVGSKLMYFQIPNDTDNQDHILDSTTATDANEEKMNVEVTDDAVTPSSDSTDIDAPSSSMTGKKTDFRQFWEQAAHITQSIIQQAEPALSSMSFTHFDKSDPTSPRGCLDLWKDQVMVAISLASSPNIHVNSMTTSLSENILSPPPPLSISNVAPTPFCLTILVKAEVKWKLCMNSQEELRLWLLTLSDIIMRRSVQYYNEGLSSQGSLSEAFQHPPNDKDSFWKVDDQYTLLPTTNAQIHSSEIQDENKNQVIDKFITSQGYWNHRGKAFVLNILVIITYLASLTWISVLVALLTLNSFIFRSYIHSGFNRWIKRYKHETQPFNVSEQVPSCTTIDTDFTFKPQAGSTIGRSLSTPNASESTDPIPCSWTILPSDRIQVRGVGYTVTKKKIAASYALYEPLHVDIFKSKQRISEMATKVQLPPNIATTASNSHLWNSPDIFVISLAVPTETPKLTRPTVDGDGFIVTIYYEMKPETKEILKQLKDHSMDPTNHPQSDIVSGVRLFEEWCSKAPTDADFQGRFKFIPNVDNLSQVGLPSWIAPWCGKPTLIKRRGVTGFLHSWTLDQTRVMEFDVNFHPFPYLAKSATAFLKDSLFLPKFLVSCSFVIEGRCDDELPELLIGDPIQVRNLDLSSLIDAETFFTPREGIK